MNGLRYVDLYYLGAAALTAVVLIALAWWLWRRTAAAAVARGQSTCARCGYVVTTAVSWICPECGSDLRTVGINRIRGRMSREAKLSWLWSACILVLVPSLAFAALSLGIIPAKHRTTILLRLAGPQSQAYADVLLVAATGVGFKRSAPLESLNVELALAPGRVAPMSIYFSPDRAPGGYMGKNGFVRTTNPVQMEDVFAWYEGAGLSIEDESVKAEAAEVLFAIRCVDPRTSQSEAIRGAPSFWQGGTASSFQHTYHGGHGERIMPKWYWAFALPLLFLWWLGIRAIHRKPSGDALAVRVEEAKEPAAQSTPAHGR